MNNTELVPANAGIVTQTIQNVPTSVALPGLAAHSVGDMERMAGAIFASGLFGYKSKEQALALMLLCQSEGLHPMQAVRRYHVLNQGRPTMRADAMQAEFQRRGGRITFHARDDKQCHATFEASGTTVEIRWTFEDAVKKGLTRNQTWQTYPRQMLHARCVSEGVRAVTPDVVAGIYTPEEIQDGEAMDKDRPRPVPSLPPVVPQQAPQQIAQVKPAGRYVNAAPEPQPESEPLPAPVDPADEAKIVIDEFRGVAKAVGLDATSAQQRKDIVRETLDIALEAGLTLDDYRECISVLKERAARGAADDQGVRARPLPNAIADEDPFEPKAGGDA